MSAHETLAACRLALVRLDEAKTLEALRTAALDLGAEFSRLDREMLADGELPPEWAGASRPAVATGDGPLRNDGRAFACLSQTLAAVLLDRLTSEHAEIRRNHEADDPLALAALETLEQEIGPLADALTTARMRSRR